MSDISYHYYFSKTEKFVMFFGNVLFSISALFIFAMIFLQDFYHIGDYMSHLEKIDRRILLAPIATALLGKVLVYLGSFGKRISG